MKKAETSIALIMTITIAVAAVAGLLMMASKTTPGTEVYCDVVYEFKNQFFYSRNDVCEEKLEIKSGFLRKTFVELTTFPSGSYEVIANVDSTPSIILPKDADVFEATINLRPTVDTAVSPARVRIQGGDPIFNSPTLDGPASIEFAEELKDKLKSCSSDPCNIAFAVTPSNGELALGNLYIRYRTYLLEDSLLDEIMKCWVRSRHGELSQDIACKVLAIPDDYSIGAPITEASMTETIKKRKYCHIIQNKEYNCGLFDQLDFKSAITNPTNVLIEYDGELKRVVVS